MAQHFVLSHILVRYKGYLLFYTTYTHAAGKKAFFSLKIIQAVLQKASARDYGQRAKDDALWD